MRYQRVSKSMNKQKLPRRKSQTTDEQEQVTPQHTRNVSLISLQRTVGNRGVQNLIEDGQIQSSEKGLPVSLNSMQAKRPNARPQIVGSIAQGRPVLQAPNTSIARRTDGVIQRGWFDDAVDAVSDNASSVVDVVTDTASSAYNTVSDAASGAYATVSDAAGSAYNAASGAVDEAWNAASGAAGEAWNAASGMASNALDAASGVAGEAWNAASGAAGDAWNSVKETAGGIAQGVTSFAGQVWEDISGGASAAWDTLSDSAKAAWEGVVEAARAVGGLASDVWAGLKSLGEEAWRQLVAAGSAVWAGIKWFGGKAWDIIKEIGVVLWEKLCFYGDVLWSFISNIPVRLWRVIVDVWEGVQGVAKWIGEGAAGFMSWLSSGLSSAAQWALDFIANPSFEKLGEAVKGIVRALRNGALGALGWVWDGISRAADWALKLALHILELLGLGEGLSAIWGTIFHLRPLSDGEKGASASIHGAGQIPYDLVWVDEGSLVTTLANKFGGGAVTLAVTTMHILHIPTQGDMPADLAVHELTHVAQYEKVGGIYMAQAIHAQIAGSKYDYGDLTGKHFNELDREAQAELCDNYYLMGGDAAAPDAVKTTRGGTTNTVAQMRVLIAEMRAGGY